VVRRVLREELAAGHVESDGNGHLRIVVGAFAPSVIRALAALNAG
jgi:hypothetical protein